MFRHTRLLTAFLATCLNLTTSAQTAKQVLDNTVALFNNNGIEAAFIATSYEGTTPAGEASGTMYMKGNKFKMASTEMTTWFDGQTQWSLLEGSDEVNVTEPSAEEQAAVNPAVLLSAYKQGYNMRMRRSTLRGKPTFVVTLTAKSQRDDMFSMVLLDIEQGTYTPYCIRAKQGDNWLRLVIRSFRTGLSLADDSFVFPSQDYPDVDVIDLR